MSLSAHTQNLRPTLICALQETKCVVHLDVVLFNSASSATISPQTGVWFRLQLRVSVGGKDNIEIGGTL